MRHRRATPRRKATPEVVGPRQPRGAYIIRATPTKQVAGVAIIAALSYGYVALAVLLVAGPIIAIVRRRRTEPEPQPTA